MFNHAIAILIIGIIVVLIVGLIDSVNKELPIAGA